MVSLFLCGPRFQKIGPFWMYYTFLGEVTTNISYGTDLWQDKERLEFFFTWEVSTVLGNISPLAQVWIFMTMLLIMVVWWWSNGFSDSAEIQVTGWRENAVKSFQKRATTVARGPLPCVGGESISSFAKTLPPAPFYWSQRLFSGVFLRSACRLSAPFRWCW